MSGRIRFANQLRGLAALSVAASHLVAVFWLMPGTVSSVTFSPAQPGPAPGLLSWVSYAWFNLGPFGVGVFFLISGFVIPFSLEKHSRFSFAVARLLRIYPTYIVALLLEVAVLYAAATVWDRPFTMTPRSVLSNALLIYDLVGEPSLDLVNWTLSVELKFYLLAILLLPAIRQGRAAALIATALAIVGLNAAMSAGWLGDIGALPSTVSYTFSSHSVCLAYMLIGVAFNFHLRHLIPMGGLLLTVAILALLFVLAWRYSVWAGQYPVVTLNYLYALGLFAALYSVRDRVPANRALDALAAISFPFYIVHSLMGYLSLRVLITGGHLGYYVALAITIPLLLLLAAALHWLVERPTVRAGHRFARGWGTRSLHITSL